MPFVAPSEQLAALGNEMRDLAKARPLVRALDRAVKGILKAEFATGAGPSGAWKPTVQGKQALLSRKLPTAFRSVVAGLGIEFVGRSNRDLLVAHQEGHVFPQRHVKALKQFLTFNRRGRLMRASRALTNDGRARKSYTQIFARAHQVGRRVLPQRQIVPEGSTLPGPWDQAIGQALSPALDQWAHKAAK